MKQSNLRKSNTLNVKFEDELIEAAKKNNVEFWLKNSKGKRELNSKKLLSNISETFILQPKVYNYLLKNLDTIEELKKIPFSGTSIDPKLLKTIVSHFDTYYDPMSYLPRIKNVSIFDQIIAACENRKVSINAVLGLTVVMDKALLKDKDSVIKLLKYFAKHCTSNDELVLIINELPAELNNVFTDQVLDCTSYVYTKLEDKDFSNKVLNDPEFKKGKKLFGNI